MSTVEEARALFANPPDPVEREPTTREPDTVRKTTSITLGTKFKFNTEKLGVTMRQAGEAFKQLSATMKRQMIPGMLGPAAMRTFADARAFEKQLDAVAKATKGKGSR